MEQRNGFFHRVVNIGRSPLVEVVGMERVLIENHLGIIAYGSDEIIVRVRDGCICVSGKGLRLASMTNERLVIIGIIQDLKLSEGGR